MQKKKKIFRVIIILVIITALVPYYFLEDKSEYLRMYFINVGQGDGILIKTPEGKTIVIDGGAYNDFVKKVSQKLPFRKRNIDLLVITHAHADHYIGLINLIERYEINTIFYSGYNVNLEDYNYLMNLIKEKNINLIKVKSGQVISFEKNINLEILHPFSIKEKEEDINNTSVVIRLSYKNFDAIFTGDMTCEGEKELVEKDKNLESELLKIGHHGSRWASCDYFLEYVKPQISVIQVGIDNSFNHPHQETLQRLEKINTQILRNDQSGDIIIYSDGEKYFKK
ncbi:MAG: ComEC/Rec2 family competence protein [Patescibacteria group bacterium]|nr:ComEC/Rec2 family competence protein [Patescibacteria group bacterium]MDD4304841.1 ComEC/Rec2 family competence protein [Patescibacteria group bacterium]MDD4695822.1 ComEC/Rec2 family competence protein [Patescibacteria group bacterium]